MAASKSCPSQEDTQGPKHQRQTGSPQPPLEAGGKDTSWLILPDLRRLSFFARLCCQMVYLGTKKAPLSTTKWSSPGGMQGGIPVGTEQPAQRRREPGSDGSGTYRFTSCSRTFMHVAPILCRDMSSWKCENLRVVVLRLRRPCIRAWREHRESRKKELESIERR